MADRRRAEDSPGVAVEDTPTTSATEKYERKQAELVEEERRLAALVRRQEAGQRLSREESLDKTWLQDNIGQLRQELEPLRQPKEEEELCCHVEELVSVHNRWCPMQQGKREVLIVALRGLGVAAADFMDSQDQEVVETSTLAASAEVGTETPAGWEVLQTIVSPLPQSRAVIDVLLLLAKTLTEGHLETMRAAHVTAQPKDVRHVLHYIHNKRRGV